MDIRQLRYFVEIASCQSVTAAAKRLLVAQPALSRHLRNLECELGVVLLERSGKGAHLTKAGKVLYQQAQVILRELAKAREKVASVSGVLQGEVKLAITPSVGLILTKELQRQSKLKYPGIVVSVVESMSGHHEEWLRWIKAGQLDLAILFDVDTDTDLTVAGLVSEDMYLLAGSSQIDGDATEVEFADLATWPLTLPSMEFPVRRNLDAIARRKGVILKVEREEESVLEIKNLVRRSQAISIQGFSAAADEIAWGEIDGFRIVQPSLSRTASLVSLARNALMPAEIAISQVIRDAVQSLVRTGRWRATVTAAEA